MELGVGVGWGGRSLFVQSKVINLGKTRLFTNSHRLEEGSVGAERNVC